MKDFEFSPEFCSFIQRTIPSVDAAELLLLLHSKPECTLTLEEAGGKLSPGIEPGEISKWLESYHGAGLLSKDGNLYQYRPGSAASGDVDRLAQAYQRRPVTLVRLISTSR